MGAKEKMTPIGHPVPECRSLMSNAHNGTTGMRSTSRLDGFTQAKSSR